MRLVDSDPKNLDGIEVVKLMRRLQAPTRAIVKSAYLTEEVQRQLKELGVFGVLDKKDSAQQLMDLVTQAVTHDVHSD